MIVELGVRPPELPARARRRRQVESPWRIPSGDALELRPGAWRGQERESAAPGEATLFVLDRSRRDRFRQPSGPTRRTSRVRRRRSNRRSAGIAGARGDPPDGSGRPRPCPTSCGPSRSPLADRPSWRSTGTTGWRKPRGAPSGARPDGSMSAAPPRTRTFARAAASRPIGEDRALSIRHGRPRGSRVWRDFPAIADRPTRCALPRPIHRSPEAR